MMVDLLPHWIQIPWVMFLYVLLGAVLGFQAGIVWSGHIEKWVAWLFCKRKGIEK